VKREISALAMRFAKVVTGAFADAAISNLAAREDWHASLKYLTSRPIQLKGS